MNYDFEKIKHLVDYIEGEGANTDAYRGSMLLNDFDLHGVIDTLKRNDWEEKDIISFIISYNPVLWAQCWLKNPQSPRDPLRLFHYQKSMLNCQHKYKVTRCGRQVGKTLCMAIDILWTTTTKEYSRILYVAPYQAQVKVLYEDTIMTLIKDVPEIHNSILKNPSHPFYQAEFSNGSVVKAMTAGSRSGQKGSGIRGQSNIHKLYLDEVEYMGSEAINSIVPTIFASKDGKIWASSTPTGKREEFYRWCMEHDSKWICPECKALGVDGSPFHYPSMISPFYDDDLELFNKQNLTASMYEHEVLADWGEEVEGVFRHGDIDACLSIGRTNHKSYVYEDLKPDSRNIYIMGVDWNKESTGVQIIVTEYNPSAIVVNGLPPKYFRQFARECVTAKEFTERGAVARIIALCRSIPIAHVYADEGYGSLQVQVIRKIMSTSGLKFMAQNVVAINMASTLEVIDPVTKEKVSKYMKPFMVDNAARVIQEKRVVLPDIEDEKVYLVGQMREYAIIRRGPSGQPIYSPDNEDVLTAWMLSILGFVCEYNELTKGDYTQRVLVSQSNLITARAGASITSRSIDTDEGEEKSKHGIFEKIARGMGLDYEYHRPGDVESDGEETLSPSVVARGGYTGRGGTLGATTRSSKSGGRRRFGSGGAPSRSKF